MKDPLHSLVVGVLALPELAAAPEAARLPLTLTVAFIDAAIENVDQDQNGFISREEFRELCVLLPRGFAQAQHQAEVADLAKKAGAGRIALSDQDDFVPPLLQFLKSKSR